MENGCEHETSLITHVIPRGQIASLCNPGGDGRSMPIPIHRVSSPGIAAMSVALRFLRMASAALARSEAPEVRCYLTRGLALFQLTLVLKFALFGGSIQEVCNCRRRQPDVGSSQAQFLHPPSARTESGHNRRLLDHYETLRLYRCWW